MVVPLSTSLIKVEFRKQAWFMTLITFFLIDNKIPIKISSPFFRKKTCFETLKAKKNLKQGNLLDLVKSLIALVLIFCFIFKIIWKILRFAVQLLSETLFNCLFYLIAFHLLSFLVTMFSSIWIKSTFFIEIHSFAKLS